MPLRLQDKWVWDFWFAEDGPDYHIFYLQAPRDLLEQKLRHWHASIGHAVSQDLVNWTILPDALHPSPQDEDVWDNYSTWTGSVIAHQGTWFLFYTGTNRREKGLIQRIGLATSTDLIEWRKHPANPVIVAEPQWYEMLDFAMWRDHAWRDPWVFAHEGRFHAYITARSNQGHKSARGVIAHAWSNDLLHWQVGPPVTAPGEFGQMEVPQLVEINGRFYLFFCVGIGEYADARRHRPGIELVTGTHYLVGDNPLGSFELSTDKFLFGDAAGSRYSGRVIQGPNGKQLLMTWRKCSRDGDFIGEIADPLPLLAAPNGQLSVDLPEGFQP